jgi:hypothetical protein
MPLLRPGAVAQAVHQQVQQPPGRVRPVLLVGDEPEAPQLAGRGAYPVDLVPAGRLDQGRERPVRTASDALTALSISSGVCPMPLSVEPVGPVGLPEAGGSPGRPRRSHGAAGPLTAPRRVSHL